MPRGSARLVAFAVLTLALVGCPFAMNDDYAIANEPTSSPPADDAGQGPAPGASDAGAPPAPPAPPPPPPPPKGTAPDAGGNCGMGKMKKDCKPDAHCEDEGC